MAIPNFLKNLQQALGCYYIDNFISYKLDLGENRLYCVPNLWRIKIHP